MTDQPTPIRDNANRDMAVRTQALDMALRSNCGQCYDTNGKIVFDAGEIVKAASAFESFIKGENLNAKNAVSETSVSKKENW